MKLHIVKSIFLSIMTIILFFSFGCKKQDKWLDVKRNKSDVVPETLTDFQAILDNVTYLNNGFASSSIVSGDNIYIPDANLAGLAEPERNLYLWNKNIWINDTSFDWNSYYAIVEYSNIVLDGLLKLSADDAEYKNVKGQALFWRSLAFYQLAQTFAPAYNNNPGTLGIPTRTSSDVNVIYQRTNIQSSYDQMTKDLKDAINLLPTNAKYITRPMKSTAMALMARLFLSIEDYDQAYIYANLALNEKSALLDFNSPLIQLSSTYKFPSNGVNNPEILLFAQGGGYNSISPFPGSAAFVDLDLYNSYLSNDLRKSIFYATEGGANLIKIRGTYTGNNSLFFGIAVNEMFLIRSECYARFGKTGEAMADLNTLLKTRFKTGSFTPLDANSPENALKIILEERRKELAFVSNIRWEDLRRLNKDSKYAKTLTRTANGTIYTLLPNDPRYVFPIPENEIRITGIQQNYR